MKPALLVLLLFPLCVLGQNKDTVAFKKANCIIVVTNKPAQENFELLLSTLSGHEYAVQKKNDDSLTVHTQEQLCKSSTMSYSIGGWAKENEIVLWGKYSSKVDASISGASYKLFVYDIANSGNRNSVSKQLFEVMTDIGRKMNGQLFYAIQNTRRGALLQ